MEIPPRLSEQQKFILGWMNNKEEKKWDRRLSFAEVTDSKPTHTPEADIVELSWAVANEFNTEHKDRIFSSYEETEEHADKQGLEKDSPEVETFARILMIEKDQNRTLTPSHRSSVTRSLSRLEERGLIERRKWYCVLLTDEGRECAKEIIRRNEDGRYSLSFENLKPKW